MIFDLLSDNSIKQMNAREAYEALQKGDHILLDVRTTEEMQHASIPGSIKLCLADLNEANLTNAGIDDKKQQIIVHCHSGGRSQKACKAMKRWGYHAVANLDGGILDWQEMGYETE